MRLRSQQSPPDCARARGGVGVTILVRLSLLACCLIVATAVQAQKDRLGGIEIGSKGIKATVIEVSPGPQGSNVTPLLATTANTTLANLKDGKFRPDALTETGEEVEKFRKQLKTEFKVADENIHVIASSGLPRATNFDELNKLIKDKTGKGLQVIDANAEVALTILGVVKPEYRDRALLVDVGSGNTKGGVLDKGATAQAPKATTFSVPLGTVTFTALVKKDGADKFAETAAKLRATDIEKPLTEALAKNAELGKRNRVYLSGGIAWALVTLLKPDKVDEAFVPLTAEDIEAFHALVTKTPGAFPEVKLDGIKDAMARARADKDLQSVRNAFTPENLVAGSEILRALATGLQLKNKETLFPRHAVTAWLQSFVEGKTTVAQLPTQPPETKPKTTDDKPKTTDDKPKTTDDKPKPKPTDDKPKTTTDDKPKTTDDKPKTTDDKPKPKPTDDKPKTTDDKPKPPTETKPKPPTETKPSTPGSGPVIVGHPIIIYSSGGCSPGHTIHYYHSSCAPRVYYHSAPCYTVYPSCAPHVIYHAPCYSGVRYYCR